MSGNHRRFAGRQFAFDNVQIGAANTARVDTNQNFTVARRGNRRVGKIERIRFHRRR